MCMGAWRRISVSPMITSALRLGIPLLYALIVPTVFHEWFYANYTLAYGIWYAMIALVVLSWGVTIVRRVREWL